MKELSLAVKTNCDELAGANFVILFAYMCCVGDLLGFILAWFSLLPIFILVGFVTLILFNRNIHTVRLSTVEIVLT